MQDLRPAVSVAAKDWLSALNQFESQGRPYALVTVLRSEPPASARAGDKAVVTSDGAFYGWIGGGCAQPVVRRAIDESLASGVPITLRITPNTGEAVPQGVQKVPMACHSGGSVELFIEPHQPAVPLHIYGTAPVAYVLADLASRVGIPVTAMATPFQNQTQLTWAVIATQGQDDIASIRHALDAGAHRLWFIASHRKWSKLRLELQQTGTAISALDRVTAPAGLPIGAKTPEEIALSVLAAVVAERRGRQIVQADAQIAMESSTTEPSSPPVAAVKSCCGGV
ncbi:MAG: XdhC family protein [Burkholderiaceae bacterium]|jgi:xanthine dehydrogenase accessory factor|nr:XdhC family protein [Pseudomonadota bacterium]MDP4677295.1 XdhC family protein [Burkholderiaceae bacterium]MDP4829840.1 XdhC family protein [Burkholderiaceae bacterium]MDP4920264.1 XdhC family protein [Burkholderiaceae bacterium]HCO57284.1 hypothetical protein [Burkholderiales bacterium]